MKEDQEYQDQLHYPLSTTIPYDTSSLTYPNSHQDQRAQEPTTDLKKINGSMIQLYLDDTEVDREALGDHMHGLPGKWMSSKMRLMRKMIMGDDPILSNKQGSQALHQESNNNGNNSPADVIVRFCSNCSTTKTPLWRSGPQGPKSLCNACGIRQMKARRAMRAAAAMSGGPIPTSAPEKVMKKEMRLDVDRTVPFKKRFKIAASSTAPKKKLRFDEVTISLSKKKIAFQQTFPQEEKDAAILLMALSCGLIYG